MFAFILFAVGYLLSAAVVCLCFVLFWIIVLYIIGATFDRLFDVELFYLFGFGRCVYLLLAWFGDFFSLLACCLFSVWAL